MSDTSRILLTGATGFLGSHLCHRLLGNGCEVTALARASKTQNPKDRVVEVLARIAGSPNPLADLGGRLVVVEGDISEPGLGMDSGTRGRVIESVDEVWHSAASLSFLEEDRDEIFRMNVEGTRHVVDFTSQVRGRRLHHISTAYVAGKRTGLVPPDDIDVGQGFKNPYEESKAQAEMLIRVAESEGRIGASVYRPSIVIGDSVTGVATHFHGVYAFIRGLWTLIRRLRSQVPETEFVDLPLRILGSKTSTLNFVPIDYVAQGIINLACQEASLGQTFHMANPNPTENRLWLSVVCDQLKVRGIRLVGEASFIEKPMTRLEGIFHRQMKFYSQYLAEEPRFDCALTEQMLEGTGVRCPGVTSGFARKMTGWYLDLLSEASTNTV